MKSFKIWILAAFLVLIATSSVYAVNLYEYEEAVDYNLGKIVISGETDKTSVGVTVQVFKADKNISDFAGNAANASNYVVYVGQTTTDAEGKFSISFVYNGDSNYQDAYGVENLKAWIAYADNGAMESYSISFVEDSQFESVVSLVNEAADENDLTTFTNLVNRYPFLFGLDSELAGEVNQSQAITKLYNDVKINPLDDTDSDKVYGRGINALVAQAINERRMHSVRELVSDMAIEDSLKEDILFFVADNASENSFLAVLHTKTVSDNQDLTDALKEATILTAVKYPKGFMNLKNVCEKYSDLIGITGKVYPNTAYSKIAGSTNITTLPMLKTYLDNNSGTQQGTVPPTGGGGGGISLPVVSNDQKVPQTINMPFNDLGSVEWAHTAISALSNRGIINGKSETQYCPSDHITREEIVKIIVNASGTQLGADHGVFADVNSDSWYAPYVNAAYHNGLCQGVGNSNFGVGLQVSRQDAAVMIYNALVKKGIELPKNTQIAFSDTEHISDYALDKIVALSQAGIVKGDSNQNFNPKALLTRAEAAQLVYNCLTFFEG